MNAHSSQHYLSEQYGTIFKGSSVVQVGFEPANETTRDFLEQLLAKLGYSGRPTSIEKRVLALSDIIVAHRNANGGLIGWPMQTSAYAGLAYGADVARWTRNALLNHGSIIRVQRSSKRDGLTALYSFLPFEGLECLEFRPHLRGRMVEIRSRGTWTGFGSKVRGKLWSWKKRKLDYLAQMEKMTVINFAMAKSPLTDTSGRRFSSCRRIFNGSMTSGGRLYGSWQDLNEAQRLSCTIDGEALCEIDFKASFLSIANATNGGSGNLPFDPYQAVSFVRDCNDLERAKQMRNLAKLLVSAYLCNGFRTARFPRGARSKFKLRQRDQAYQFYNAIINAFPFLRQGKLDGLQLMFIESEIIINTLLSLISLGIVAYPVHDCILCKARDSQTVIEILVRETVAAIGVAISLDVTWHDGTVHRYQAVGSDLTKLVEE